MSSVLRHSGAQPATARPMVGDTKTSMVRSDHIGWLLCDGRELSQAEYRALYSVLGDDFGPAVAAGYFKLPDSRGHVMGLINQPNEYTATPRTDVSGWRDGDVSGEQTHTLILNEIPAHNHDISGGYLNVSGGLSRFGPGQTSAELTRITLGVSGEHYHTYLGLQSQSVGTVGDTGAAENDPRPTENTSFAGLHSHVVNDPTHRHQIASNGGSQPHNNMQPTLFLGNLFIYGGRVNYNIPGFDGATSLVNPPSPNPSYYPPRYPSRLH